MLIIVMNKTETELREIISQQCKEKGRQAVAESLKVTPQYISMLLRKDNPRGISKDVAEELGYVRESATTILFVPKNNSQEQLT